MQAISHFSNHAGDGLYRLKIEAYHNLNRVLRKAATRSYLSGEVVAAIPGSEIS